MPSSAGLPLARALADGSDHPPARAQETTPVAAVAIRRRGVPLGYQLCLPQFEGPIHVLLSMIERHELEVTGISLAAVTDQYLAHVAALPESDPSTLADFVALGARLVLIKSRALLPRPMSPETSDDEMDDADRLAEQLAAYRQARATAIGLAARLADGHTAYDRVPEPRPARATPPALAPVTLDDLIRVVRRRLLQLPTAPRSVTLPAVISLADKLLQIENLLALHGQTNLTDLLDLARSRAELVVTFMALLELLRRRRIVVAQARLFAEIDVRPAPPA